MLKINKSPVLTSNNYGTNFFDVSKEMFDISTTIVAPKQMQGARAKNLNESEFSKNNIDTIFDDLNKKQSNFAKKVILSGKNEQFLLHFDQNSHLVDNLNIVISNGASAKVALIYQSKNQMFHSATLKFVLQKNSKLKFDLISALTDNCDSFLSIQIDCQSMSQLDFNIVDFCSKTAVQNIQINCAEGAVANLNSIYFGAKSCNADLKYLINCKEKNSTAQMNVVGVLKDRANKNFVGTINFERGAKNSKGAESEHCILLSTDAKSKSTPMLLCKEEDVDGTHSSSVGKVDDKQLFYVMARGFDEREATELIVNAKLNIQLSKICDESVQELAKKMLKNFF